MIEEPEDNSSVFVRRTTRAMLAWLTTGAVAMIFMLLGYILKNQVDFQTRIAVIEKSGFTNGDADKMRNQISEVREGYKDAMAILGGKIDLVDLKISTVEKQLSNLNEEMKRKP